MKGSKAVILSAVSAAFLVFIVSYLFGALSFKFNIWPYSAFVEVWRFVQGDPEERTTLAEKILNDAGILPARHLFKTPAKPYPASAYRPLDGLPLDPARQPPLVYMDPAAPRGFRIIFGTFAFRDALHGAVLLGPDGTARWHWKISQDGVSRPHHPETNVFPHGFEISPDGSILASYDNGSSLTKYDYCGRVQWRLEGEYHHSIDFGDDGTFWVWKKAIERDDTLPGQSGQKSAIEQQLQQIAYGDGALLRSFGLVDIIKANPGIGIFATRGVGGVQKDPFHPNDIDPLPRRLARHYPQFRAGDLMISMRPLNLIFVLDPDSLKVKWWRQGQTRRQHDPDWNDLGTITIFNNNMDAPPSTIVELDPRTMVSRVLVDGAGYDFYTAVQGKHDQSPGGHVLITSTQQGRVFEVAPGGKVTFDFQNIYTQDAGALFVSEARFLPLDFFKDLPTCPGRK